MRTSAKVFAAMALLLLGAAMGSRAATCTSQAAMQAQERDALAAAGMRLGSAVLQQDLGALQSALLPAEASDWEVIRSAVEQGAPLVKGGRLQLRNIYLLDAAGQSAVADTQFFCSNASGSLTVTLTMRSLPPGRFAVVLADAFGAPLAGQIAFILAWEGIGAGGWRLGGVSIRQGSFGGHDGVWYWGRAREAARNGNPWASWYSYEAARALLLPVDFISSPNLEKLANEQSQLRGSPQDAFPISIPDGNRVWKIESVRLDTTLREPDLGVTYDSTGVTDPGALRTEATAVLSAFLKLKPELRDAFHGLWAYSLKDGKTTPVMELPMAQIP